MGKLYLDQPVGHEVDISVGTGYIVRSGLYVIDPALELPVSIPSYDRVTRLKELLIPMGLPDTGESYPDPDYSDYFCKRHIFRALNAYHTAIQMIYEFRGLTTTQDTSTLSSVPTQLHPADFTPLYVNFAGGTPKLLTLQGLLPLRHFIIQKTVDFEAGPEVLDAFGGVNDTEWMGLPRGYWLFSGIDGNTVDGGITYTYTATFTTKQREDWSQLGFMVDDTGSPVSIPPAAVAALRATPYDYTIDDSVDGVLKVGLHHLVDFADVLGWPPPP